jgi:hypothetical protein
MNDKFEEIWKEAVAVWSRFCPFICLEKSRKTPRNVIEDIQCPGQVSKLASPEYRQPVRSHSKIMEGLKLSQLWQWILWNVRQCSLVYAPPTFRRNILSLSSLAFLWFIACIISLVWEWKQWVQSFETSASFYRIHDSTSQKICTAIVCIVFRRAFCPQNKQLPDEVSLWWKIQRISTRSQNKWSRY